MFWLKNTKCKKASSDRQWNPIDSSGSINQIWTVVLLLNVMSLLIVKYTTNKTETFLKNVKWKA